MLVWAVASQKGGVGKTTTVASLAGWLQKEHLRVLIIDTDPHASLTSYLGFEDEKVEHNLFDLYAAETLSRDAVVKCITHTRYSGLDIITSSMTLATIDRQLSGRSGVGRILSKALALVDDLYDVVLIDCPPVLGALMVNALVSSTLILVPTQTEFLALKGLQGMVRTFSIMNSADDSAAFDYIILPTMFDKRTKASNRSIEYMRQHYGQKVWESCIPIDTMFRESSSQRIPLPIMDENTRGAKAYRELFCYLVGHELSVHPGKVSPSLASVLTDDDFDDEQRRKDEEDVIRKSVSDMVH
ncbi:Sporulation initiation inhibitor protein soj [Anaerobiospirillum thomasii]|uniref:Sporulation initiation inhibitor protein soj n=2 Tax=Gammaproteobacteria TaxID=1236 RepID=A0A2X0VK74_9GAMM|nr:ParA family protein [Anaerobiospirillum thomasii]SPT69868.1 Sporulation initiation inhibitor protein soj [Anaerobiospirillum thomasii]SPT71466.1 Sporulation initiation inhibitor protein soj [Anaerobiospirillum thomasii]